MVLPTSASSSSSSPSSPKTNRCVLFISLCLGVFLTFLTYALVEESIFNLRDSRGRKFASGWYLTMVQFGIDAVLYAVARATWRHVRRRRGRPPAAGTAVPMSTYVVLSVLIVGRLLHRLPSSPQTPNPVCVCMLLPPPTPLISRSRKCPYGLRSAGNGAYLSSLPHLAASSHWVQGPPTSALVPRVQRASPAWFGGPKVCLSCFGRPRLAGCAPSVWVPTHIHSRFLLLRLASSPRFPAHPAMLLTRRPRSPLRSTHSLGSTCTTPSSLARSVDGALKRG